MPRLEQADVLPTERLHHPAQVNGAHGRRQQVDVIVHQHIGVQPHSRRRQRFPQQLQIVQPVAVIEEARQAVVSTLHDVLRNARQIESRCAAHTDSIARTSGWRRSATDEAMRPDCAA